MIKAVLIAIFVLAVLTITAYVVIVQIRNAEESAEKLSTLTAYNESLSSVTETGVALANGPATYRNSICTVSYITFKSNESSVPSADYAQKDTGNCVVYYNGGDTGNEQYNNTDWNVTYSITYNKPYAYQVGANMTMGPAIFFQNVPTFLILLGVVVLIMIISIIIVAVTRFQGGGLIRSSGGGAEPNI